MTQAGVQVIVPPASRAIGAIRPSQLAGAGCDRLHERLRGRVTFLAGVAFPHVDESNTGTAAGCRAPFRHTGWVALIARPRHSLDEVDRFGEESMLSRVALSILTRRPIGLLLLALLVNWPSLSPASGDAAPADRDDG